MQEVVEGTDDFVLWIFTISSVFMFSGSRNPLRYAQLLTSILFVPIAIETFRFLFQRLSMTMQVGYAA